MRALSFISTFALVASCAPIKIYDDPWCLDAGAFGAECFNTISNKEFSLNKYEWDKLRLGQACTATQKPAEGYLHFKVAITKACADSHRCTVEQQKLLDDISAKFEAAQREASESNTFSGSTPADSAAMEEQGSQSLELQLD